MSGERVRRLVDELARETSTARARAIADELRRLLRARSASRVLHDDVERAFARHGLRLNVPWTPAPLAIGEAWLLLAHGDGGSVARLAVARADGTPHGRRMSGPELRRVYEGLVTALRQRGAAPPARSRDDEVLIGDLAPRAIVSGDSLGAPVCVALVSAWLDRAPRTDVATTAEVLADGRLRAVGELPAKLAALARAWPGVVTTVIVARDQPLDDELPAGMGIERADDIVQALALAGLEVSAQSLPPMGRAELHRRLDQFAHDHDEGPPAGGWSAVARQAWEVSEGLRVLGDQYRQARALSWAMLFALHAGDIAAADDYRRAISVDVADEMDPLARTWFRIGSATTAIDRAVTGDHAALTEARELAGDAVEMARTVMRAIRRELYGRALGTLGRVCMHDEDYPVALRDLGEAAAFHREYLPTEAARSHCYLATCQRLAGEPVRALATIESGVDDLRHAASRLTAAFLDLERGRCLLELGEVAGAQDAFARVLAAQAKDSDYPRLSARRGLACALRAQGDVHAADDAVRACLAVAADPAALPTIRKVAALAAGEALVDADAGRATAISTDELWRAWHDHYRAVDTLDGIRRAIRRAVY